MQRCPKCRLLYAGGDLRFCRFDGSPLISEAMPPDEAETSLFPTGHVDNRYTPLEKLSRGSETGKLSK